MSHGQSGPEERRGYHAPVGAGLTARDNGAGGFHNQELVRSIPERAGGAAQRTGGQGPCKEAAAYGY